jgi:outer membrane protein assembly factor BamB
VSFRKKTQGPRLWPVYLILAAALGALAWIWRPSDSPVGMSQTTLTLLVGLSCALLLLTWWLFFSRTRLFTRLAATLGLVAAAGTLNVLFEIRGLSGDLVPQVAWRGAAASLPAPPAGAPPVIPSPDPRETRVDLGHDSAPAPREGPGEGSPVSEDSGSTGPEASPSFPQFLGPSRDATLRGVRLARGWPSAPVALWRQPIGKGWSGFAVADGLAVTLEQRDGKELVVAYDLESGKARWSHRGGRGFESAMAGDGPRATPSIDGGRVFTLGVNGVLTSLDLASGRVRFEKDVLAENGASRPEHGVAASPLVVDDVVVVAAGGPEGRSLVAYDARTGERRWSGGDDPAAYSSPRVATLDGVRQIVVLSLRNLSGHDLRTGAVLWRDPWPERAEKVSQPVVLGDDLVFASMGYGVGGRLVKVSRSAGATWRADLVWRTRQLKAKFTQVVAHRGFLYGLDEGVLVCLDPKDGERRWKSGRYGHGQVLLVDDLLLVQAEDGEVVLVEPSPERHVELARFQAVEGRAWATPALVGDLLLVRGDAEAACYRLPIDQSAVAAVPLPGGK